jgi:glycosyltransferase involved in cell wall biosynthesis
MGKLVTIGIPIYKRLEYLPNVLNVVARQDYPHIELLVSDNGMNGPKVPETVKRHYSRPFKFRQNDSTVGLSKHFNQIVHAASGDYFVMLADDDEISPNYVSALVSQLERYPQASVALGKQEIMSESGTRIRQSKEELPDILSGADFITDAWQSHVYEFECFATCLAKTEQIRACGGYPEFRKGSHNDNALLIKLSLNSYIAFNPECSFMWRVYETSHGWSISIWDLAADTRQFLRFLETDPTILKFGSAHPVEWKKLKSILVTMAWNTYFTRWNDIYRSRLSPPQWVATAFAMPPIAGYYKNVAFTFGGCVKGFFRSNRSAEVSKVK